MWNGSTVSFTDIVQELGRHVVAPHMFGMPSLVRLAIQAEAELVRKQLLSGTATGQEYSTPASIKFNDDLYPQIGKT